MMLFSDYLIVDGCPIVDAFFLIIEGYIPKGNMIEEFLQKLRGKNVFDLIINMS